MVRAIPVALSKTNVTVSVAIKHPMEPVMKALIVTENVMATAVVTCRGRAGTPAGERIDGLTEV